MNKKIYLALLMIIILFAAALVPTSHTYTHGRSSQYLTQAMQISQGREVEVYYNRPVGFSLMIALVFKLFGISVTNAHHLVRMFYALNIVMIFLLASELFDPVIGAMSSMFFIMSESVGKASLPLNLDPVVPVFVLLSILFFAKQSKSGDLIYSALSGLALGAAYLVKEIAILYAALPLLIIFLKRGNGPGYILKSILIFYASFAIVVAPWALYLTARSGTWLSLLGGASPEVLDKYYSHRNFITFILNGDIFKNLSSYYREFLKPGFALAPLMVIAWAYLLLSAVFRRGRNTIILAISGALFLPMLIYLGNKGDRIGHSITFFDLSFIAVSYFITRTADAVTYIPKGLRLHPARVAAALVLGIALFAALAAYSFVKEKTYSFFKNTNTFYLTDKFEIRGRHSRPIKDACDWINENTAKGETVYVDGSMSEAFDFFTKLGYERQLIGFTTCVYNVATGEVSNPVAEGDVVLGIWPSMRFKSNFERSRYVELVTGKAVRELAQKAAERPVLISLRNNHMSYYLERAGIGLQYGNYEAMVYGGRADDSPPVGNIPFLSSSRFAELLPWLRKNHADDHARLFDFLGKYGLTEADILGSDYGRYQRKWVNENIPQGSRIALSCVCDVRDSFLKGYNATVHNKDHSLSSIAGAYDYLFIHHCSRYYDVLPRLFKELQKEKRIAYFPQSEYLGDGMGEVYKLGH